MTKTNPETCHACGQVLPGEVEEQEKSEGLTREQVKQMTPQQVNERWDEVSKFLEESR